MRGLSHEATGSPANEPLERPKTSRNPVFLQYFRRAAHFPGGLGRGFFATDYLSHYIVCVEKGVGAEFLEGS